MDSADLRVFRTVAREGSITQAAERLGYVQSNVTARIKQLESELGTQLFVRHNRGMKLSSSGKILLPYADKIVGLLEEAAQALSSSNEPRGALTIGSSQTTAAVRLPKLLTSYYRAYPNVTLSVTTGDSGSLIEKVLDYELDGAFIGHPCHHPEVRSIPAFLDELVLVSAPWIADLDEAAAKPILVLNMSCSYRDIMDQWSRSRSLAKPVFIEMGTLEAIIGGAAAGLGISLLPRMIADKHEAEGAVRTHPVPDAYSRMATEFIVRRDSFVSGALHAFIEHFQAAAGGLREVQNPSAG